MQRPAPGLRPCGRFQAGHEGIGSRQQACASHDARGRLQQPASLRVRHGSGVDLVDDSLIVGMARGLSLCVRIKQGLSLDLNIEVHA